MYFEMPPMNSVNATLVVIKLSIDSSPAIELGPSYSYASDPVISKVEPKKTIVRYVYCVLVLKLLACVLQCVCLLNRI